MAMTSASTCPEVRDWQRLLAGLVSEEEAGPLEQHLEACVACQRAIRDLPDADALTAALHGCAATTGFGSDVVEAANRLIHRVRGAQAASGETLDKRGLVQPTLLTIVEEVKKKIAGRRYQILRPHDKGGIGEVCVALDQELNRKVALKEIQERHADDAHTYSCRTHAGSGPGLQNRRQPDGDTVNLGR
jgi:hypothetical protein